MEGGTQLLALTEAAHARVRNAPLLLLQNQATITGEHTFAPLGQLQRAFRLRGEARARALWRATADISEEVYRPYLLELWKLTELAEGRVLGTPPNGYSAVFKAMSTRLAGIDALVEPLCVRVRNAGAHGHARYLPEMRRIELTNKDGWRVEMPPKELERMGTRMWQVAAGTYPAVVRWFMLGAFLASGVFPVFLAIGPAVERDDKVEIDRLGREIESCIGRMYGDLARLFATGGA